MGDKSNPYIIIKSDKKEIQSKNFNSSLNPEWNWSANAVVNESSPIIDICVYNSDRIGKDDLMGSIRLDSEKRSDLESSGATWLSFDDAKTGKLLISCKTLLPREDEVKDITDPTCQKDGKGS